MATFTTPKHKQMAKITVQNTDINIVKYNEEDYISLTDMARSQLQEHIIFRCSVSKALSNISANGKCYITTILIIPNSVQLEIHLGATTSCFR